MNTTNKWDYIITPITSLLYYVMHTQINYDFSKYSFH